MNREEHANILERLAAIENEAKWIRYLVMMVFAAVIGQYLGVPGDTAAAFDHIIHNSHNIVQVPPGP